MIDFVLIGTVYRRDGQSMGRKITAKMDKSAEVRNRPLRQQYGPQSP